MIRKYAILSLVLLTSCEVWMDPEFGQNPNQPSDVPMHQILPAVQASLAYNYGGNETVALSGNWMQHFHNLTRTSLHGNSYFIDNSTPNTYWKNMYTKSMTSCVELMERSVEQGSPHWRGLTMIHLAISIAQITDLFGDVPFSEAFGNSTDNQPALDSQEFIYNEIHSLLDQSIIDLQSSDNAIPLSGDLIHNGDTEAWIRTAYALKARYYLRTSRIDSVAGQKALTCIENAYSGSEHDMLFRYGNGQNEESPLYQLMRDRGLLSMAAKLIDTLESNNDPRLKMMADTNYEGSYVGTSGSSWVADPSLPNPQNRFFRADGITVFMSYTELKFIEAEAALITDSQRGTAAYRKAVESSLREWDSWDEAWFDAEIHSAGTPGLADIYLQKWIALYGQAETYHDWRRSDNEIGLKLSPIAYFSQIPYRWPYPSTEITNNDNVPKGHDQTTPVWWMGTANPGPYN